MTNHKFSILTVRTSLGGSFCGGSLNTNAGEADCGPQILRTKSTSAKDEDKAGTA